MDDAKLMTWINHQINHYSTLSNEALTEFDELQADPDCPMFTLTEAKLHLCRCTSRQIALTVLRKNIQEGHFD